MSGGFLLSGLQRVGWGERQDPENAKRTRISTLGGMGTDGQNDCRSILSLPKLAALDFQPSACSAHAELCGNGRGGSARPEPLPQGTCCQSLQGHRAGSPWPQSNIAEITLTGNHWEVGRTGCHPGRQGKKEVTILVLHLKGLDLHPKRKLSRLHLGSLGSVFSTT